MIKMEISSKENIDLQNEIEINKEKYITKISKYKKLFNNISNKFEKEIYKNEKN
jgi:hypothetical protein